MKYNLAILMGLLFGAPSFLLASLTDENKSDSFLFCLKKEYDLLEIQRDREGAFLSVQETNVQNFINKNEILDVERWLPHASNFDKDGEIYLNRIYRFTLDSNRKNEIPTLIRTLEKLDPILYAEPENIHKILYTPNDTNIDEQCSLSAVKAYDAWNFWDVENGDFPGSDNQNYVLLASVDTGVDYTHPDLQNNAWINQGEIPSWTFQAGVDSNGDGYIESEELVNFLAEENMDFNNDGIYNLRDLLYKDDVINSPFLDGIDGDANSYTDDIVGWDASGYYGNSSSEDSDPYPKEDVLNTSTWAHGTHVAGILAATTDNSMGMAAASYNAKFISVKASKDNQSSDDPGINHGYQGILYAAKAGYNDLNGNGAWDQGESFTIINNSWGGGGYSNSENSTINVAHNTYGAIVVGAAGNGDDDGGDEYAAHYPSSYTNCISVCAMACSGNWGNWATYHHTIDLASPGENIFSTVIGSGYASWDGSSMASPNAASAIGLLSYYYPEFSNEQLREKIEQTADNVIYDINPEFLDCDGSTGDYCLGSGMVDVYKAIGESFSPSISFESYELSFNTGNGDNVLNPGESVELFVSLSNEEGWTDADYLAGAIATSNENVIILNNYSEYGLIEAGTSSLNLSSFTFSVNQEISLGDINFEISITADGSNDYTYLNIISFQIPVTMDQSGFPFNTNFSVKSSPLAVDFDNDGEIEIIFGDNNGLVHVLSSDGSEWDNELFPFDAGDEIWGSLAYADIDLDGLNEIVVSSKSNHLYAIDINGVDFDFDAGQFLVGTPAIGDFDSDEYLEVIVSGYLASGDIFIVSHDGSFESIEINEKANGVALADFNNDDKDDIIIATENNDMVCMINNSGQIDTLLIADDKFKTSPSILDLNGEKMIMVGSYDNNFYAIDSNGDILFSIEVSDDIVSSPSFVVDESGVIIFFSSDDGYLHAVYQDGSILDGWPLLFNSPPGEVSFSDLNGDQIVDIIVGSGNEIYVIGLNGVIFDPDHFPVQTEFPIESAPLIADFDNDNDLEIVVGTSVNLEAIDITNQGGSTTDFWYMDRGNNKRTGLFETNVEGVDVQLGDVNFDGAIDIFDIIMVVNIVIEVIVPSSEEQLAADLNQDGAIDVFDIISLVNIILD